MFTQIFPLPREQQSCHSHPGVSLAVSQTDVSFKQCNCFQGLAVCHGRQCQMLCCHAKGGREGVQSTLGELLRVVTRGQLSRVETRMNEAAAREALGGSRQEVGASQH